MKRKLLALFLCLLMLAVLLPAREVRADDRTEISTIVATSNMNSIAVCGQQIVHPTFTVTQGAPAYFNTNNGDWYKKEGDEWVRCSDGIFTPGTWKYGVQIRIDGEEGVTHTLDKTGFTVKVDGKSWTLASYYGSGYNFFFRSASSPEFTIKEIPISSVSVTITAPTVGAAASYSPVVPSGAPYTHDGDSGTTFKNGVLWRDTTEGYEGDMNVATASFTAGHTYRVTVYLVPNDGYAFTDGVTGTINGKTASVRQPNNDEENWVRLQYTFPALSASKPTITTQPSNKTVSAGSTATFKVVATGATGYQWQWSKDGTSWNNCSSGGYNTATFSFTMSSTFNGRKYRCVVSNAAGSTTSSVATATLLTKPAITTQPKSVTASVNTTVKLTVAATGTGLQYKWQWSKDGTSWKNCSSGGYNTATFSFTMASAFNGRKYRCVVSNAAGSTTSSVATVTLLTKPAITTQPKSVTAAANTTVKLTVAATGTGLQYKWQWSKDGTTWNNCSSGGYNTATFSFTMSSTFNGRKYRCVVSNAAGSTTSSVATVTVK